MQLLKSHGSFGPGHCNYGVNSQGYRCPEFDTINWQDSILLFGCSHVFGIGLEDEETAAHQLSLILNIPVINLGMGASSYTYQWINSTILRKHGVSPKAVVYIWPEEARQTVFVSDNCIETTPIGWWSVGDKPDYTNLGVNLVLHPFQSIHMSKYIRDNMDVLWDCPVLHYTSYLTSHYYIGIPSIGSALDFARDGKHRGPISNRMWAENMSKDLKKFV
jgi:hypothetical protein